MTLYAFDDIDDAIDATRAFLWPFSLRRWAKLALVMFFVGGAGGNFNPFQFNTGGTGGGPTGPGTPGMPDTFPSIGGPELAIVLTIVGVLLLIALLFLLVGSIMEFVFVESLRREAVAIRRYWGERWGQGVRLFAFRLVLSIVVLAIVGALVVAILSPILFGNQTEPSIPVLLLSIPVFVLLALVAGLLQGFTTVFVVPIMIAEGGGVLSGWRRFWPTMTGQWKQYVTYAIMGVVLQLAAGIVAFLVILIPAILLLIPFGIAGLFGFALLSTSQVAGWFVIGLVATLFILTMVVIGLFVTVPIQSFLRYYALFVLGDTNEAFDLIPERRQAVREDDAAPAGASG